MANLCVVGSINYDVVTSVKEYPLLGQTVIGKSIDEFHGGKGANQAVACAQQEKSVSMIGAVGSDSIGQDLIDNLKKMKVKTDHIAVLEGEKSGQTTIILDEKGENVIIYVGGANNEIRSEHVKNSIESLKNCHILLTQMESPSSVVLEAMKKAKEKDITVIFDPAPPTNVSDEMLTYTDIILPNVHEAEVLTGVKIKDLNTAKQARDILHNKGVKKGVFTLGSIGSYVFDEKDIEFIEATQVKAIDTVGAGDCFAASLASALLDGNSLVDAAKYASFVSALKVTKSGAQIGMPSLKEIIDFAKEKGFDLYFLE